MADDQGKTGFDAGSGGAGDAQKDTNKKVGDHAGQMRQERAEFKQEFGDRKRKRRRRRHRKGRGSGEGLSETKTEFRPKKVEPKIGPELKSESQSESKSEPRPESVADVEPKFQDKPVNPFEPPGNRPEVPKTGDKSPEVGVEEHGFGPSPNRPINPFLQTDMEPADEGDEAEVQPQAEVSQPEVVKEPETVSEAMSKPKLEPEAQPINPFIKESFSVESKPEAQIENKREVIDVTPEEGGSGSSSEVVQVAGEQVEEEDFKQEFWTILEQAGITKKRILIFLIVLVVLIVGLIFFFSLGDEDEDEDEDGAGSEEEEIENEEEGEDATDDSRGGKIALEVVSSYIFGLEYVPKKPKEPIEAVPITEFGNVSGVEAGFILGDLIEVSRDSFVTYIDLLRRMDSLYNTDVYSLVNLSTDRRAALTNHLSEMDSVITEGLAVYNLLEQQLTALDSEYIRITEQRDLYEVGFFEDVAALRGQNAYEKLNLFREFSKSALDFKADYNAKKTVRDMLVNSLNLLRPRYEDLFTNSEALIKGVKVFDLPGSDIDAIVPVE